MTQENYLRQKRLERQRRWNEQNKDKVAEYRRNAIVNAYAKLIAEFPQYKIGGVIR